MINKEGQGQDAASWADAVTKIVGGKAGGKGSTAIGQGSVTDGLEKAVDEASKWFESLKI